MTKYIPHIHPHRFPTAKIRIFRHTALSHFTPILSQFAAIKTTKAEASNGLGFRFVVWRTSPHRPTLVTYLVLVARWVDVCEYYIIYRTGTHYLVYLYKIFHSGHHQNTHEGKRRQFHLPGIPNHDGIWAV